MAYLSSDILYDILRRLDGPSLASAACTCSSLSSLSREETLWENVCKSMWPSTDSRDATNLILSIGGFRKFYADCFPLIVNNDYHGQTDGGHESFLPADLISLVDIRFGDRIIWSKVLWGIPDVNGSNSWFHSCPFRIDLLRDEETEGGEAITLSVSDGLQPVSSLEKERKDGKLWRDLRDRLRLSWIIVNRKIKKAVNLSSWSSLGGHRHWPTEKDFVIRFGSVLPARPQCRAVECVLTMKCRVVRTEEDGYNQTRLGLTELGMELEDMEGSHVNGRNSMWILAEALRCRRSRNYSEALELRHMFTRAQRELREEKMRSDNVLDRIFILSAITAFLTFCYFVL
ncbi:PREDICTED: probable F-box protein At1g60180 isoform X2 [Tarenaya hassleriana]|nr:PREDICTED: probable F-box protein At1g60180 isoform X2 [Tarenaya hassleriana]